MEWNGAASAIVKLIGFAFSFLVGYGRCQRQGLRQKRENKAKTNWLNNEGRKQSKVAQRLQAKSISLCNEMEKKIDWRCLLPQAAHQAAPLRGKPSQRKENKQTNCLFCCCWGGVGLSFFFYFIYLWLWGAAPAAGGWWGVLRNAKEDEQPIKFNLFFSFGAQPKKKRKRWIDWRKYWKLKENNLI